MHCRWILIFSMLVLAIVSCRQDEYITYIEDETLGHLTVVQRVDGMYLINEGNMGSNKCSIDYLDLSNNDGNVHYVRNIYAERNPHVVKELGDVGNDIAIYGSRLWMVINCSNKVEVATADSCRRIGQVDIANCRYLAFADGYAYISSYAGPVKMGLKQLGMVYKVDTLTLQKVDSVVVGYQPEEMVVNNGLLYVVNSGGYNPPEYDNTMSVVNLPSMKELRKVEIAINLHRLKKDAYGRLWVSSRGNYGDVHSALYCLENEEIVRKFDVAVSDFQIVGDSLYYFGSEWNNSTGKNSVGFGVIDMKTLTQVSADIFNAKEIESMQTPYGIVINPDDRDFYLMDAKNYVSSGELLHFLPDGTFDWRVRTGDIPSRAAFVKKKKI